MQTRPEPYRVPPFVKGKPILATSLEGLRTQGEKLRKEPIVLPSPRGNSSALSVALFKITAGPTAVGSSYSYYTARKQKVTDFASYADASTTNYKLVFLRASQANLPSGSTNYVVNTYYLAWYFGKNSSGDELWIANDMPGFDSLVAP